MTLARPAYRFTVTNLDNPWTYTIDQGDPFDPAEDVQLRDGLNMSWDFEDGIVPGQMQPDTLTFSLYVREAAHLPAFDKGDRITASLLRPLAVGTTPYMHFVGRITDADTEVDPQRNLVILELVCVDSTSELGGSYDFGIQTFRTSLDESVGEAIYNGHPAAVYNYEPADAYDAITHYPNNKFTIREHVTKILNAAMTGIFSAVLRPIQPSASFPVGWTKWAVQPNTGGQESGRVATIEFYPHKWKRGITAVAVPLLKFASDTDDPDRVVLVTNPDANPVTGNYEDATLTKGLTVLPANRLKSPLRTTLNRGVSQNRIELTNAAGWVVGESTPTPVTTIVEDTKSVTRYGAVTRQIESVGNNNLGAAALPSLLQWSVPGAKWAAETLVVATHTMTDAELDQYANHFAPQPTVNLTFRRHIAVLDIQANVDVSAGMLFGDLVGASFVVANGRLAIELRTKPAAMYFPNGVGGPTVNDWNASAWANTYVTDQGGVNDYIDPEITFDHVAVSKI